MLNETLQHELENEWFPNMTDSGLNRVIELLETGSPFLIHGAFNKALPMGCLATHIAWHHPFTEHLTMEAGVCWLHKVAGLNPATSLVIREWDKAARCDIELRQELLFELKECRRGRRSQANVTKEAIVPTLQVLLIS